MKEIRSEITNFNIPNVIADSFGEIPDDVNDRGQDDVPLFGAANRDLLARHICRPLPDNGKLCPTRGDKIHQRLSVQNRLSHSQHGELHDMTTNKPKSTLLLLRKPNRKRLT